MKITLSCLGLILCLTDALAASNDVELAKIPYAAVRAAISTNQMGVLKWTVQFTPAVDDSNAPPVALYIDSCRGKIPLKYQDRTFVSFPVTPELEAENPMVVVNRPKGTMSLEFLPQWNFKGDYDHPHRCRYRDLAGFSVFVANVYRLVKNKPPVAGDELLGWAPRLVLEETAGKKARFEIIGYSDPANASFSKQTTGCALSTEVWRANPEVVLAFDPATVKVQGDFPPHTFAKYNTMRMMLQTKRVGIFKLTPEVSIVRGTDEWPPLEVYIHSKSGKIKLTYKDLGFPDFPFTKELANEDPYIVINRSADLATFHLNPTPATDELGQKITCKYRDLMAVTVGTSALYSAMRRTGDFHEVKVDQMKVLPWLTFSPVVRPWSITILSRQEKQFIKIKPGETRNLVLDKKLWHENPSVILDFDPTETPRIKVQDFFNGVVPN